MTDRYDIAIVGAGASGLAAAIEAKRTSSSLSVALLDREDRVGKKILSTGNGRCNLSNENITPDKYTGNYDLYRNIREKYGDTKAFFSSIGLLTWTDSEGRVYPYSNQASTVLNLLRKECERLGVEEVCGFGVCDIKKEGEDFLLHSEDRREIYAGKVIISCGTPAGNRRDPNGELYEALSRLGHKATEFTGALAPIYSDAKSLRSLKGVRTKAGITLKDGSGKEKAHSTGEVQFGDGYLGGICVMDVSAFALPGDTISLDLCPDLTREQLSSFIEENRDKSAEDILAGILPKPLVLLLYKTLDANIQNGNSINNITNCIKNLDFPVIYEPDISRSQVCCGGFGESGVNPETLESTKTKNLYFCGELLGVTGKCGGYNLDFAWASGRCAGSNAAGSQSFDTL